MRQVFAAGLLSLAALAETPEQKAIQYLAREVPRWYEENHCFSCHNNGDAARALYAASRLGYSVPAESLSTTTHWLESPPRWEQTKSDPAFSDKKLARLQFAAALTHAYEAGLVRTKAPLIEAAESLTAQQHDDGSWPLEGEAQVGSPVTWGTVLSTYMARRTLERADRVRFAASIAKATRWLRQRKPENILETAAILLAFPSGVQPLQMILRAQASDGGWGPQIHAPAEVFDTAVVLLALSKIKTAEPALQRGRAFLISKQLPSGGWPETTRPPGGQSYAQQVSTSAWAALALVSTNLER